MLKYFILLFLLFSACQRDDANQSRSLTFWCSNNAGEITFAREFTRQWQRNRPDKPLRYQPIPEGQSSEEIILASVVGKTTPDIYANMWQGSVEMYAKARVLVPLDTLAGFRAFINARCDSAVIREITSSDGHIYQVPWKVNPIMLLCNTRAMDGLSTKGPPYTYSSYTDAGRQFKRDKDGDGYVDQWLGYTEVKAIWYQRLFNFYPLYLAASKGAPLLTRNPNGRLQAAFNNRHAVSVFRFLQTLYRENYFAKERLSATRDPFLANRIATQFTGPWTVEFLEKYKDPGFDYGSFPMPVPDGHTGPVYSYGDPKNIVIFNTCRDPQAAWEFIKTLVDQPGDLRLLELTGQFPRRKNLDTDPYFAPFLTKHPRLQPFARQTRYIKGVDNSEVIVEVFDIISQEYEACVIFNKKTPESAIADAARAVDVLLMSERTIE
ncbi:extracellular solute-binding protein [Spirosoma utsteinense]|uniref:Multiple sugar transport system substrate-binding protein n=1 Tax=Spirosoma utsteinense TaxID=2585773 RepID=A0ABR6WBU8_9BACT|nr:extracellular solute-binding protein [Spirosoma utsteinense]MBC3786835.1 multiple sugar transport system substrate-binding protein [Spirosoma utsteinense]MBC3793744.1 multiple sugar transport system substrate-binding protein [Spirosoma utsteinense]